jgi:anti-sigma factor RsiW
MNAHLNEQQFGELLLGSDKGEIAGHVEACDACRAEVESVRTAISGFRELAQNAAERDDIFWARQRFAIKQRMTRRHSAFHLRWVATAAMVLVVSAAFLLRQAPQPLQRVNNDATDDVLLQQVQSDIDRNYPAALAPAVLIDDERNSALSSATKQNFSR